jgi:adenylosuccinate synthase
MHLHYVLGITKAYSTRVGEGPFPTELSDDVGERLRQRGQEFGATTGRPRRTGWFDAAALKRSIQLNGVSGCASPSSTCSTARGAEDLRRLRDRRQLSEILPVGAEELELCVPVYEELPGWQESTVGVKTIDACPRPRATTCSASRRCAACRSISSPPARIARKRSSCATRYDR